jgi:hypothetical protein
MCWASWNWRARPCARGAAQALLHGLSPQEAEAMAAMDRVGLQMAAASYRAKRAGRAGHGARTTPLQRWWRRLLAAWT